MNVEILKGYDHYYAPSGASLDLCFKRKTIHYKNIKIILNKLPYLIDRLSGDIFFTSPAVVIIENHVSKALSSSREEIQINQFSRFNRGKLPVAKNTKFRYPPVEHFFIPGLIRNIPSDGYLTPVYFDKNVLVKFEHAKGYQLVSQTATAGRIKINNVHDIPYGINKNGSVIMWLGDIVGLPSRELMYLYSENIEPEYDLHSDFYRNQIFDKWLTTNKAK